MLQFFGSIQNPLTTLGSDYGDVTGAGGSAGGLVGLISNILRLIAVAGGLFALFNIITAGMEYITSKGDPKGIEAAKNKIYMSIIGLVIIVGSFAGAAVMGKLLFGSYNSILRPTIYGPGSV